MSMSGLKLNVSQWKKLFPIIIITVILIAFRTLFSLLESTRQSLPSSVLKTPGVKSEFLIQNDNGKFVSSFSEKDFNLLRVENVTYLKSFQNPCWYQTTQSNYSNNRLISKILHTPLKGTYFAKGHGSRSKRLRCLPYFYLAGFSKCGTTDLYEHIMEHPNVFRPYVKDPQYWSWNRWKVIVEGHEKNGFKHEKYIPLGINANVTEYVDLFDEAADKIEETCANSSFCQGITGDGSPSYAWIFPAWRALWPNHDLGQPRATIADILHMLTPQARIIFILREPANRLYSEYMFFEPRTPKSPEDFAKKVRSAILEFDTCVSHLNIRSCLYDPVYSTPGSSPLRLRIGLYSYFLEDWLKVFSSDQVLILKLEEYALNRSQILSNVFHFLDVRKSFKIPKAEEKKIHNKRAEGSSMLGSVLPSTRKMLQHFYQPYNKELDILLWLHGFTWNSWTY